MSFRSIVMPYLLLDIEKNTVQYQYKLLIRKFYS